MEIANHLFLFKVEPVEKIGNKVLRFIMFFEFHHKEAEVHVLTKNLFDDEPSYYFIETKTEDNILSSLEDILEDEDTWEAIKKYLFNFSKANNLELP